MNKEEIAAKLAAKKEAEHGSAIESGSYLDDGQPDPNLDEGQLPNPLRGPGEVRLSIFRLDKRARTPTKAHPSDIGYDIYAHLLTESGRDSTKQLPRYSAVAIPTGLVLRPPLGYYCQICSRSGWALQGVFVANSPGIIDPDYSGEIRVILYNGSHETKWISHGMRIGQIILQPIVRSTLREITDPGEVGSSGRGIAGFGSSGL